MHQNQTKSSHVIKELGSSDKRNLEYSQNFSAKKFFDNLISSSNPIIFDIGAHKGESINFFKSIYDTAKIYSFEPEPENFILLPKQLGKLRHLHLILQLVSAMKMPHFISSRFHIWAVFSLSINNLPTLLATRMAQAMTRS